MKHFEIPQSVIDEVARLEEYDRKLDEQQQLEKELEADECIIGGTLIGHLAELPTWAQSYIINLRRIANERN